jgi:hypothetical protein
MNVFGGNQNMRIMAYIEFHFFADKLRVWPPEEKEDTMDRLRKGLDECEKIPGLLEMHFVHGRDPEAFSAFAKVEVDEVQDVTNVINEVKKTFPLKTCTTHIVQPQIKPGRKVKNPNFL